MKGKHAHPLVDYGWRLHGQPVSVLRDRSFTLDSARQPIAGALLSRYSADAASLISCLQCGMCTVSCNLAEEGNLFPRRQMTFLQLGQKESLAADPGVWLCFNCTDCSSRCPANARPGRIMAAIRQMVVEHYSVPASVGRLVNDPKSLPLLFLVPALLLLAAIALGGSLTPVRSPVRYATMLPHLTLNLLFLAATGFASISALSGASRAWTAFAGESIWRADPGHLIPALRSAMGEILAHRKFSECEQFPLSRWAHAAVLYGFLTLLALAGWAATCTLWGAAYPFPALHPAKIAGNLAGALLISGSAYFAVKRRRAAQKGDSSSWFDWALLMNLLLTGVTGMLTEIFRYADLAKLAYPMYFVHLVFAFVLLAGLPYSKLAHVVYRTLALTARQYGRLAALAATNLEKRTVTA